MPFLMGIEVPESKVKSPRKRMEKERRIKGKGRGRVTSD